MSDLMIEVPCCQSCFDWMKPVLLIEYPVQAAVWICLNGCATLIHGFGYEENIPDEAAMSAFSSLAHQIGGER